MPNIFNQLIVIATVELANAVLIAAALSFLGLGVQPPLPDWGLMIAEGKQYLLFSPYLISPAGAAMMALVLAVNLLGDGIRDVTDPEARGR
ncbi:MAG: ABC transporter permease subunit [Geminicoccaceae bacterium]